MTVIIEYVLIDNFALDFMLASLTASIFGIRIRRAVISALLGTACAFVYPLVPETLSIPYALLTLALCVLPFCIRCKLKQSLKISLVYVLSSAGFSGIISLILDTGKPFGVYYSGGGKVALICFGAIIAFCLCKKTISIITSKRRKEKLVTVSVNLIGLHTGKGFFDDGNSAIGTDGGGVVFLNKTFSEYFKEQKAVDYISVKTVNGCTIREIIKIPELRIYSEGREHIYKNVNAVKTSENYEDFDVLLSCNIKETGL